MGCRPQDGPPHPAVSYPLGRADRGAGVIELSTAERDHLATLALVAFAGKLRREAKRRDAAGPELAGYRARTRERARQADQLAEAFRAGRCTVSAS